MGGTISRAMVGSVYEFNHRRTRDFPLFMLEASFLDDTILTVVVADVLLNDGSYGETFKRYSRVYPKPVGGYGSRFCQSGISAA